MNQEARGFVERHAVVIVLLLTVVGGVFRFATFDRPGIWYDEAQTYRRVCGSFGEMMGQLRGDGFMPLHYWVEWCVARLVGGPGKLTPFWLRFVPALAGTLMIPAMYWLARQFCGRRNAAFVAAFTTCSAYLNFYSHDAKMYMPLWLLAALSMASLLTWLRTGRKIAWAGWVVFAALMVGFHAIGLIVVGMQLMAFFVMRGTGPRPRPVSAWAAWAGALLILVGPALYYVGFNRWARHIQDAGWQGASGLHWLPYYNAERDRPQMAAYAISAYLTGWEWPARGHMQPRQMDNPAFLSHAATHGYFIAGLVRVAFECVNVVLALLAAGSLAWCAWQRRRGVESDGAAIPWARPSLLLAIWTIVPVFAFFEVATHPYVPRTKLADMGSVTGLALMLVASPSLLAAVQQARGRSGLARMRLRIPPVAAVAGIPLALCFLIAVIVHVAHFRIPGWGGVWSPRYMGVVWPAGAIAICVLLSCVPFRMLRCAGVFLLLATNCVQSVAREGLGTRPPAGQMADDVWNARDSAGTVRTYLPRDPLDPELGESMMSGAGKYYLCLAAGKPLFTPASWLPTPVESVVPIHATDDPAEIATEVASLPAVRRVVVWQAAITGVEALPNALGSQWRRTHEDCFTVRGVWNWSKVYELRRCEYERADIPEPGRSLAASVH